ncbi:MAG: hypothetical protein R3D58_18425 [Saprospiraceae bacterium]|nr:ammonium transporter [Lewinellaceae bacterium]
MKIKRSLSALFLFFQTIKTINHTITLPTLFLHQLLALTQVSMFTFFCSCRLVATFTPLRVTEDEGAMVLDISQHGEFVFLQGKNFSK